jgi:hypothetical protein
MAHKARAEARRLVPVATSALLNGDLERACSVLRDLQTATSVEISGAAIANGSGRLPVIVTSLLPLGVVDLARLPQGRPRL